MIFLWVFLVLCYNLAQGQFPRACTTEAALRTKTCCPLWKDKGPCGSIAGRGKCRDKVVFTPFAAGQIPQYDDDRLNWPRFYYDKTCECFGNYSGFDCGVCRYGYVGEKCDRKNMVTRQEIRELSLRDRKTFFSYLAMAKTTISRDYVVLVSGDRLHRDTYRFIDATIYNIFSWIHSYSMNPILRSGSFDYSTTYAHQGPAFCVWHRLGILFLESEIQRMTGDETFAIPYYDWRGEKANCSICSNDFLGDNDVQGRLSKYSHFYFWKAICSSYSYDDTYCLGADDDDQMQVIYRKPGVSLVVTSLPTEEDVENAVKWETYDRFPYNRQARQSFRNVLEGFMNPEDGVTRGNYMHNSVHGFFGGTMGEVAISSNDPMFLLHHCFVDKVFEEWMCRHNVTSDAYPENNRPGQGPEECSTPYFPCYRNKDLLRNATNFGYAYSKYQGF